jgi:very-short-patch-repair endonuclease
MAWAEVRYLGLPFWPQFPIGKYFADFANPIKKIVIECDGKAFHNHAQDSQRDAFMIGEGWTVYRISGADCNRVMNNPWEEINDLGLDGDEVQAERIIHEWLHRTIDGLIAAISYGHFAKYSRSDYFKNESLRVLQARRARGF